MKAKPFRYNIILPRLLYRDVKREAKRRKLRTSELMREYIRNGLARLDLVITIDGKEHPQTHEL